MLQLEAVRLVGSTDPAAEGTSVVRPLPQITGMLLVGAGSVVTAATFKQLRQINIVSPPVAVDLVGAVDQSSLHLMLGVSPEGAAPRPMAELLLARTPLELSEVDQGLLSFSPLQLGQQEVIPTFTRRIQLISGLISLTDTCQMAPAEMEPLLGAAETVHLGAAEAAEVIPPQQIQGV
jgi:hypothetical protein